MNQGAFNQIVGELAKAGLSLETEKIITHLEDRRITPGKELQKMEFLFRLFHKPCFPRGELVAFSGKAKMTLCFREEVLSVERIGTEKLRVLWYDTEQSEESTQDILRHRIIPMSGMDEQDFPMQMFDIFNVRADMYDNRLPMLETAVSHYHPDLVILDGIRDLIADINDGVVAQDCIERLMKLASTNRCCIVCVLHQNKAAEDRNLRGWIGTELKNKAFEVYECNKSERIFSWSQTDTRKYDILDKLQFSVDEVPKKNLPRRSIRLNKTWLGKNSLILANPNWHLSIRNTYWVRNGTKPYLTFPVCLQTVCCLEKPIARKN